MVEERLIDNERESILEKRCYRLRYFIKHYCSQWKTAAIRYYELGHLTFNDVQFLDNECEPKKDPENAQIKKPPLGVAPRKIWLEERRNELGRAIIEYVEAGLQVKQEWCEELNQITKELEDYSRE